MDIASAEMGSNAVAPLVHLRQLMSEYDGGALQAFLVPSEDAHQVNTYGLQRNWCCLTKASTPEDIERDCLWHRLSEMIHWFVVSTDTHTLSCRKLAFPIGM